MILKIPSISMNYTIFLIIQGDLNKARRSVPPDYYVEIIAKKKQVMRFSTSFITFTRTPRLSTQCLYHCAHSNISDIQSLQSFK